MQAQTMLIRKYATQINEHVELNQPRALHVACDRLFTEFGAQTDYDTICQIMQANYDRLEARAHVSDHLPLLAERATRERLQELAAY